MIFLMITSVVAVINFQPTGGDQLKYGDVEFVLEQRSNGGSVLIAEIDGRQVEFQNLPTQVTHLEFDTMATGILRSAQQIALTVDPNIEIQDAAFVDYARLQIGFALGRTVNGITQEHPDYSLPVIDCSHASPQMAVVVFNLTNETASVTTSGACVILSGEDRDMMRLKDRVIFEYHDILRAGEVVDG